MAGYQNNDLISKDELPNPDLQGPNLSDSDIYSNTFYDRDEDLGAFEDESDYDENDLLSDHNRSTRTSSRKTSGRKAINITKVLNNFFTKAKHPKREFLNIAIIRLIKRIFRNIQKKEILTNSSFGIDTSNKLDMKYWDCFKALYSKNPPYFNIIADTANSPCTDGKTKKIYKSASGQEKTFNKPFCRHFFSHDLVQEAFIILIEFLFYQLNPSKLNKRFKFSCCTLDHHSRKCYRSWYLLRDYMNFKYIKDLEVPYNPKLIQILKPNLTLED